jgi:predicted permease
MLPWMRRLTSLLRRGRLDDDLADEIQQHIERRRESLIAQGMDPVRAAYEARRQFGNVTRTREESRDMWGFPTIDNWLTDVRYALRLLGRAPMFATIAISSLAISIGAAIAVFGLIDAVLLRKLPVVNPDELLVVRWQSPITARMPAPSLSGNFTRNEREQSSTSFSLPTFQSMRRESPAGVRIIGFAGYMPVNFALREATESVQAQAVSGNYFETLGLAPAAGRLLADSDDRLDAPAVAVISYAFWRSRFAAAPDIAGRAVKINGLDVTIVGVMPEGFSSTLQVGDAPDVTVPLALRETLERTPSYRTADSWWVLMMARVPRSLDAARVQSQLESVFRQSTATGNALLQPDDLPHLAFLPGARGQEEVRNGMREPIRVLALIVVAVLLVACVIVANLLLARGQTRAREITVRVAIGASRARVVRQLVTEGLLLACLGSGAGMLVARWTAQALIPAFGRSNEMRIDVGTNWRIVVFTVGLAILCAAIFAVVPALRATAVRVSVGLQDFSRTMTTTRDRRRLARGLITVQVALSVLLIATATLLVRTVVNLRSIAPGFDASNLLIFRVDPGRNGYSPERMRTLYGMVLDRLANLPGVRSASLLSNTLIGAGGSSTLAALPSDPPLEPGSNEARLFFESHGAFVLSVSDRFFATYGIPVIHGRGLAPSDTADAQPVVVINQALARRLFGTTDVRGKQLKTDLRPNPTLFEVVGVVADAKYTSLRREAPPTMYFDYRQRRADAPTFAVKTAADPLATATAVSDAVRQIDPDVPLFAMRTQSMQIEQSLRSEQFLAQMATLLGVVALLLCGIGLFGLLTYDVTRRTPEIGLRLALGAERRAVSWMILRQSLLLTSVGLVIGIPAAIVGARVLRSLLFGLTPNDPSSFAVAAAIMLLAATAAAYFPARRASRVDPVIALRAE